MYFTRRYKLKEEKITSISVLQTGKLFSKDKTHMHGLKFKFIIIFHDRVNTINCTSEILLLIPLRVSGLNCRGMDR